MSDDKPTEGEQQPEPTERSVQPTSEPAPLITMTPTDIAELMRNRFFLLGGGGGV